MNRKGRENQPERPQRRLTHEQLEDDHGRKITVRGEF